VGIPIFSGAQNSRIKAAKTAVLQAQTQYDFRKQQLTTEYLNIYQQYKVQLESVRLYESSLLKNAETILNTINLQFRNGAVNYLEWAMLVNQAITIRSGYFDAIQNLNRTYIQLETLTGNN
jgi:cobalt-zinc-cadmium resistance protein CzcA